VILRLRTRQRIAFAVNYPARLSLHGTARLPSREFHFSIESEILVVVLILGVVDEDDDDRPGGRCDDR
jgi:hypothetical protein